MLLLSFAGLTAVLFAVLMMTRRTLYASAFCFLIVLSQVSAIYYLLGAHLLAFLQVMVYAGAIMVLIVVAIMATPPRLPELWAHLGLPAPLVGLGLALAAAEFAAVLSLGGGGPASLPPWPAIDADFSAALFGPGVLATEAAGLLVLLAALAVVETRGDR